MSAEDTSPRKSGGGPADLFASRTVSATSSVAALESDTEEGVRSRGALSCTCCGLRLDFERVPAERCMSRTEDGNAVDFLFCAFFILRAVGLLCLCLCEPQGAATCTNTTRART